MSSDLPEDRFPLTPIQAGMLVQTLAHPSGGVDFEQIVVTLRENVDATLLFAAWQRLVNRHSRFRSHFDWSGPGEPVQIVSPSALLPSRVIELPGLAADRPAALEEFLEEDRRSGFDPTVAPLSRVALLKSADDVHYLVWSFHHLLLDGRSFAAVLSEVFDDYDASRSSSTWTAPPRGAFRAHVEWSRERDLKASLDYWRTSLAGFRNPTPLPTETSPEIDWRTPGPRRELRRTLDAEAAGALRVVTRDLGVSVNNCVQVAWAIVLSRYSGARDVVYGVARACRRSSIDGAVDIIGVFVNTLPLRLDVDPEISAAELLRRTRDIQRELRTHEQTPLVEIQNRSEVSGGRPLFKSLLVFDNHLLGPHLRREHGQPETRDFVLREKTSYPLTLYAYDDEDLHLALAFDSSQLDERAMARVLASVETVLGGIAAQPEQAIGELPLLGDEERQRLLVEWNDTHRAALREECVHAAFETRVRAHPDDRALVAGGRTLTYSQLDRRANELALDLVARGVGPGAIVAVCADRDLELVIALLATLKAGAAYLPLDPTYPATRLRFMVSDAGVRVALADTRGARVLGDGVDEVVSIDGLGDSAEEAPSDTDERPATRAHGADLAYVIYTSGSTGRPKGVMVEHRNVLNFFSGMDERVGAERGTLLAVTSLSFDISVLEVFWALARGFEVVLYRGLTNADADELEFSLFYFASDAAEHEDRKYGLLLDGARYADANGFAAVWTPERHFHAFGGLYPNPAVAGAAIAAVTERVKIRAGSVVLPLHHPLRLAEEWSVVDNLSGGRVGISVASGWHPNDFVLAPGSYAGRKDEMIAGIDTVRRLWRGETIEFENPNGEQVAIGILPRPIQAELPLWITAAGNPETFRQAGELGLGVLTHLLGQSVEEVQSKLAIYRTAWTAAGHAGAGHVTMMLHTLIGPDAAAVKALVREPMRAYLGSSIDLIRKHAGSWSATRKPIAADGEDSGVGDLGELPQEDLDALLDYAFDRYFETSALFGTPEACRDMVERMRAVGVDEIACLIDFGVSSQRVLEHLPYLNELRLATERPAAPPTESVEALIRRHGVTHLQCTPSMARMLTADASSTVALRSLRVMMVGGEALPGDLARTLADTVSGRVLNMYGPTETTIWSSVADVTSSRVTIGRPIANTRLYVVDERLQPVPIGAVGELLIGGAGVTRGYLGRPELTAERFVPSAFVEGDRLYRTGDHVRYLENGDLEFLGRADQQAKVRGHRVELGEIEHQLMDHPAVQEAVVVLRGTDDDVRIVAHVIPAGDASVATVLSHARERLPDYMVPSAIHFHSEYPLTPNGKVDRNALASAPASPRSAPAREDPAREIEAPAVAAPTTEPQVTDRTDVDTSAAAAYREPIRSIWAEILDLSDVPLEANFFDLGGHSLLTVKMQTRLRERLGIDVPLVDLFRHTSVQSLSEHFARIGKDHVPEAASTAASRGARRRAILRRRGS